MNALRALSVHRRWCGQAATLIMLLLTPVTILLLLLSPEADKAKWTHIRYEPGHTRAHSELCTAPPRLVILVSSAPTHAKAREAIRATWGRSARRANIPLAFVLGAPPANLSDALDSEDAQHGDLIEGRFVDSYLNLTLKTLSMLEWVEKYCPVTTRLLKVDDDMFINVDRILKFDKAPERRNATYTIWGEILKKVPPMRDARFRYFVPLEEFPYATYPPFAVGHVYLMSADVVPALLRAARDSHFLRLEDVFVTGVLAERVGVRREHAEDFVARPAEHACDVRRVMGVHGMRFHEQFDRYAKLLDPDIACPD